MSMPKLKELTGLINAVWRDDHGNIVVNIYSQPSYFNKKEGAWKT